MKRRIQNIFILFMAVTVFFVGAGVTIVDLCCSNCVENLMMMNKADDACHNLMGVDSSKTHSCCGDDSGQDKSMLPCTNKHEGKCCDAERISVDLENRTFKPDIINNALTWAVVHCQCCCYCHTTDIEDTAGYAEYSDNIPIPPREYLSLLRTLII